MLVRPLALCGPKLGRNPLGYWLLLSLLDFLTSGQGSVLGDSEVGPRTQLTPHARCVLFFGLGLILGKGHARAREVSPWGRLG